MTDRIGRQAEHPTAIPPAGWREVLVRVWRRTGTNNIGLISAGVASYALLALLIAVWSSSKGSRSLITALNVAYDERERRNIVKQNVVAFMLGSL